jgi:hypothetical protein
MLEYIEGMQNNRVSKCPLHKEKRTKGKGVRDRVRGVDSADYGGVDY